MSKNIKLKTVIKCPICKFKKEVTMPENIRLQVYNCEECKARLKPKDNECCVFCSYSSVPCPTVQRQIIAALSKGNS